jgi:predicted metal-dependent hydrolase
MVTQLNLGDIAVDVVFKDIKNVHLSVHPPAGRVRISAPRRMGRDTIRVFAISKLDWIKKQQRSSRDRNAKRRASIWIARAITFGDNVTFSK